MAKKKKTKTQKPKSKPMWDKEKDSKPENPFELKINRNKHDVLGRKLKAQIGTPGVRKLVVNEKRKEFLKKAQLHRNKANDFVDKRIGEYDSTMQREERVLARIAESQRKQHKKRLYNLNDDFNLTHMGEPISNLETFTDFLEDSDEDEDDAQLGADFVSKAHFGGFLTKKDNNDAPKTRKEILNEFITESKKKKQDKKEAKELNDDLTAKLDTDWKEIHSILPEIKRNDGAEKSTVDPFDITVKELKFEPRGTAVMVTKNEAFENEKKIKKMEEERIKRMQGINFMKRRRIEHVSVEAIDDEDIMIMENADAIDDINGLEENQKTNSEDLGSDDENSDEGTGNEESDNDDVQNEDEEVASNETCSMVPQTLESLLAFMANENPIEISQKLESIIPNFSATKNVQYLQNFFRVLLEFIDIIFQSEYDIQLLDAVTSVMFKLAQKSTFDTGVIFKNFILEKISYYQEMKHLKKFSLFSILIHLKLCSILYSTSDFWHPVITPAMLLMSNILTSSFRTNFQNVLSRLFISHLFYEYVFYSKRFVPEAVNYLFSVISIATEKDSPFLSNIKKMKLHNPENKKILLVTSAIECWEPSKLSLDFLKQISRNEMKTENKLDILYCTITLLHKFAELYTNLPIFSVLFQPASNLHVCLPVSFYPAALVKTIDELRTFVTKTTKPINLLTFPNKKPKLRKLFAPRIENFVEKKPSNTLEKLKVQKQLSQKVKKEEKGVMRELRRDAEFEARERLKLKTEADADRKRKVKELYAQLASQEGEYKSLSKRK